MPSWLYVVECGKNETYAFESNRGSSLPKWKMPNVVFYSGYCWGVSNFEVRLKTNRNSASNVLVDHQSAKVDVGNIQDVFDKLEFRYTGLAFTQKSDLSNYISWYLLTFSKDTFLSRIRSSLHLGWAEANHLNGTVRIDCDIIVQFRGYLILYMFRIWLLNKVA